MLRRIFREVLLVALLAVLVGCASPGRRPAARHSNGASIQNLLRRARPGSSVLIEAGIYLEDVSVPAGVSIRGIDPRKTIMVGSITLEATGEHPASMSGISLIHTGGRSSALVSCKGKSVEIRHCLLISEGGFATVSGVGANKVTLRNNIISGPGGNYAVFGRGGGQLEMVNNTIIVQGFGVGLMDTASATIRNCLFLGDIQPAVIRTNSDYTITYSNISPGGGSSPALVDHTGAAALVSGALPDNRKDDPKYDSKGLTFFPQKNLKSRDIDAYKSAEPKFARHSGCPAEEDRNPDGSRNTLGAFGGPLGDW